MGYSKNFQALVCGFFLCVTDANAAVTVTAVGNQDNESFVCGNSETIICKTVPSVPSMTWEISGTTAANCLGTSCTTNPVFTPSYDFMFDVSAGIFHLTKHIVTLSDNGITFICQDGFTSASEQVVVTVVDEYEIETNVKNSTSTKSVQLTVTTGCLSTNTSERVRFLWYYKKANTNESQFRYDGQIFETQNNSDCISDPDCGVIGFTKKSSVVDIKEEEDGDIYYFEVKVIFTDNENTVGQTFERGIMLKAPKGKNQLPCHCVDVLLFLAVLIIYIQMTIHGLLLEAEPTDSSCFLIIVLHTFAHIPLVGIILQGFVLWCWQKKGATTNADSSQPHVKTEPVSSFSESRLVKIDTTKESYSSYTFHLNCSIFSRCINRTICFVFVVAACGIPFLGLIILGIILYKMWQKDDLSCVCLGVIIVMLLLLVLGQIFTILICSVFRVNLLWHIPFALFCYFCCWIIISIMALNIKAYTDYRTILCCILMVGGIIYACKHRKQERRNEFHASGKVTPVSMPKDTRKSRNEDTHHQKDPKPLRKLPKVTSKNNLQSMQQDLYSKLPNINRKEMTKNISPHESRQRNFENIM